MARAERLPLERQQPVALQIAERAVIGEHIEAIAGALEGAAWLVAPVRAAADVSAKDGGPVVGRQPAREREQLIVGKRRRRIERRGDDLRLALRIEAGE